MGSRIYLAEALSFDVLVPVQASDSLIKKILLTTLNWSNTNKNGMAFGILLGAAVLTFFRLIQNRLISSNNHFLNAFIGMIIGAPLGVCVNCATPIGKGLHAAGQKAATVLSTMHSSPTFNIVVITMLFPLFPFDFALLKVGSTALFILVIMPAILKAMKVAQKDPAPEVKVPPPSAPRISWFGAFKEIAKSYAQNLYYIVKTTLPLMLLAGFVGSVAVELFPLEKISEFEFGIWSLITVGAVGTFLPVPIAFDVVVAFLLFNAGLPIGLSMTLLFTLGIFSFYPYLIIGRDMSFKLATAIFAAVVFTGMGTGVAMDYWNNYAFQETVNLHKQDKKEKYKKAQAMVTSLCAETYPGNRNQEKSCFRREITVLAGSTFDQEFCQALTEEQVRADCVRFAKTESAVRENDPAICQQLTSGKAACLQEVVKERLDKTQDPRFCDILEQETRKKACVKNALLSQIKTNFDFTICTKLEEKRDQQQCRFDLTRHYIFSGGSLAFCDQLPGVEKKACLENREEYLATESDSLQACQQLNHENSIKKCMMQFLLKNIKEGGKSIALCQTFGNLPEQSQCTRHALFVIGKQLTFERCEQVRIPPLQAQCIENVVGQKMTAGADSKLCQKMADPRKRNGCENYHQVMSVRRQITRNLAKILASAEMPPLQESVEGRQAHQETRKIAVPVVQGRPFFTTEDQVSVTQIDLKERSAQEGPVFVKSEGGSAGIVLQEWHTPLTKYDPFSYSKGIASGDYNGDGWTDLLFSTLGGPKPFKNLGNGKFGAIPLDKAAFGRDANVMQVAFADLDNDGKPDIYLTTYRGGNFVILNEGRDFEDHRVLSLPKTNHVATMSTAFADIDGNGTLDIYQGNWSFGNMGRDKIPYVTSKNDLFLNHQLRFERVALENNVGGETLSSLFSDINGDGRPDLLVANDFDSPDQLYLGRQKGGLVPLMARNPLIPVTPFFNMSYDTADINNDLSLDIFASDMDLMGEENTFDNLPYCERIDDAQFRKFCQESFFIQEASETVKATDCSKLETARSRSVCIASVLTEMAFRSSTESYCREIPQGYATSRELCFAMVDMKKRPSRGRVEKKGHVFQVMRNVLLVAEKEGAFQEAAAEMGVLSSSWSWNSKFADLDNDEWQDIYVGNGFQRDTRTLVSNMFFHNQKGKKFARQEKDFGLEDHVITPSYTYVDYDNDGDLDVIATGMFAPVRIFTNHEAKNNLIIFELRDSKGNFYGVGSKIYVTYGDKGKRQQMRELKLGGGFQSFDPLQAHFGLGPYRVVQKVKVVWSDGSVTELEHHFQSNKKYIIKR